MQGFEIAVTLKGTSMLEVLAQCRALIEADGKTALAVATTGKRSKKASAPVIEDADPLGVGEGEPEETLGTEGEGEDQLGFDMTADTELAPPPTTKAKKITDKDVNDAAMKHAKKNGRPATLAILAKTFKVKSILELKPEQYAKVLQALKV